MKLELVAVWDSPSCRLKPACESLWSHGVVQNSDCLFLVWRFAETTNRVSLHMLSCGHRKGGLDGCVFRGLAPPTWVCCGHEGERWAEPSVLPAWTAQSGLWGRTRCFLWASSWLWVSGKESKVDKEEEEGCWNPVVAGWKSQSLKSLVDSSSLSS